MKINYFRKRMISFVLTLSFLLSLLTSNSYVQNNIQATSYLPPQSGQSTTIQEDKFTYSSDAARIADPTASNGYSASLNTDKDYPELFSANNYITISENNNQVGLKDSNSKKSVKFVLAGYNYPTITVAGDHTNKKSIRFWAMVKTNSYTTPGFTGPNIPISNMNTGVTLANAQLNQWVQLTINFADMSGSNSFGFLQDRAPLINAGSLDLYIDNIEFLDNSNQNIARAGHIGNTREISFKSSDFSFLGYGKSYDVYFHIKAEKGVSATGDAFKLGLFDQTQSIERMTQRTVNVIEFTNSVWKEYRLGTFKPDNSVSVLEFYVQGVGNLDISNLYVDYIIFKEVEVVVSHSDFTYSNGASRILDNTGSGGYEGNSSEDRDFTELFTVGSYMSLYSNTASVGLKDISSKRSVQLTLAGWGNNFPALTVKGSLSGKKSIRFWVLVKPNANTTPGFTGPSIPISNMTTGATIATAGFNQWVQLTIDFATMGGGNSFGFLYDRAPLCGAGSLDIYFDKIEFLDNNNLSLPISYVASLNNDKDYAEFFTAGSYMTLSENTNTAGLFDTSSYRSVKLSLAGWGNNYPTMTVTGNLSGKKSIRFWVLVKPNDFTTPGFIGPNIPISNMTTGETIATAGFNQWVQLTLDFDTMGGGNSFGFLYDRAPLNGAGSLDIYFDKIEFLDTTNQSLQIVAGNIGTVKGITFESNTIDFLKDGVAYDVYFKIKADKTVAASGNAFKIGICDKAQNRELVEAKTVTASEFNSSQWAEYKLSSFKTYYTANQLQFYVQGVGNTEIKDLYVDYIMFKESYTDIPDYNFTYSNGAARVADSTAIDGYAASLNVDKDHTDLFSIGSYMTLSENTASVGLKDSNSYRSVKLNLAGWGNNYPTMTVTGDLTGKKYIRFWVLVKPNEYTTPGFTGPSIPISNMTTGATVATAGFNQWVQLTIDFADMSSGNSFGFLYDRAPLNAAGSLDIYFDKIEFLDNNNQNIPFTAGNIGNTKSVSYKKWDFSWMLKYGTAYDIYFRIKAQKTISATGNAFNLGVYDETQSKDLITPKTVTVSEFNNEQWYEFKAGTMKPNYGVNNLQFYVEGVGNTEIKDLFVDNIMFVEVTSSYIENTDFSLFSNASNVADGRAADNSVTRVINNSQTTQIAAQVKIDGEKYVTGDYSLTLSVNPDRPLGANWDATIGDIMAVEVKNITTGAVYMTKNTYTTSSSPFTYKVEYFYSLVYQITIIPTDDYVINFYPVNNAANFPSYVIDNLKIDRVIAEDWYDSAIHYDNVMPYKISPNNADGINDYTIINYSLNGIYEAGKTIDVNVYDQNGWVVKNIVQGRADSGEKEEVWYGRDYAGNIVANGLYTIQVKRSDGLILLRKNVQVQYGVVLNSATTNPAKNYFPKGVWFEALNIPAYPDAARTYLDRCFTDIKEANCNTVYMANWRNNASTYSITLEKAKQYGLYIIGLPGSNALFKYWGGDYWDSEAYYINDEWELYARISELTNNVTQDPNASQNIGYLLFDEPRSMYLKDKEEFRQHLSVMRKMLEGIDPSRFAIIDYCMPEDASYFYHDNKTQALSMDIYPCSPIYSVGNFKHIGGYPNAGYEQSLDASTLQVREELTNEAPLWPILQMQETGNIFRNPIPAEVRAMAYEAIGRGAKGLSYFMYQSTLDWRGMVDYDYTRRPEDFDTVKQLNSEVEALKYTILDMSRVANVATTTGGGGGANTNPYDPGYASADVTTHKSKSSGNGYIVAVNHNCLNSQNITITIDRAKLGYNVSAIKLISSVDGSESNVAFTTTSASYTISNISFAAGDGKIFKLVRDTAQVIMTVEDTSFAVAGSEATRGNADISANNGTTAIKIGDDSNSQSDFYAYLSSAGLTANINYDVYVRVKIKYKTDLVATEQAGPSFPLPTGNAFTIGVKNSSGTNIISPTTKVASSLENMLWTDVKIGNFTPTSTHLAGTNAYVYLNPSNNMAQVEAVYVDRYFFVRK